MHPETIQGKPDFFFPETGLAIFLDGCFWHGCPRCGHVPNTNTSFWKAKITRNQQRDRRTRRRLNRIGIKTVRFWEHELRDSPGRCIQQIRKRLS
jgi:DNA mismatch endonuclease (patch repair protein)